MVGVLGQTLSKLHAPHLSIACEGLSAESLRKKLLNEKGIDTAGLRPKHVREFLGKVHIRTAITVCARAGETCPETWPGPVEQLFWPIDDPAAAEGTETERLATFRRARDTIEARISEWLAGLKQD